jgi:NAD(P)-dependent dehydrogenase (short-subunit alcohol dehydrogenase family)
MELLAGKTAVITGGTRGFGLAIANLFGSEGAAVVVASRSAEAVEQAVAQLRQSGIRAAGQPCDVGQYEQVQGLVGLALREFGRLDIWVNNAAGVAPYGPTMAARREDFQRVIGSNISGVLNGSYAAMAHFLPAKNGKLINILGRGYNQPAPLQNAYGASKAWIRSFTLALAGETRLSGVGVYAINPGMMVTELLTNVEVLEGYEEKLKVMDTVVRMWALEPEIPARKVLWLASSATDGKTGLLISLTNPVTFLLGAVKEGLRRLSGRRAAPGTVKIKVIPASGPQKVI